MVTPSSCSVEAYFDYMGFIEICRLKDYGNDLVLHNHHIIPKNMGGSNTSSNMVYLSVEDHITAHIMISYIWQENTKGRLDNYRAARIIDRYSISDKETLNKINESYMGENNPFYGKKHTKESLDKISGTNSNSFRFRKDKNYQDLYGKNRADVEKKKRSDGVRLAWEQTSNDDKINRNTKNSMSHKKRAQDINYKNPFSKSIVVDGVLYNSYSAAARALNTTCHKLKKYYEIEEVA